MIIIFFKNNKFLLFAIIYVMLIFYVSSIAGNHLPKFKILSFDKIIHCCVYFVFGILIFLAINEKGKYHNKQILFLTIIIGLLYGISDEIHQLFVLNRSASVYDVIADFIGVIIGSFLVFQICKYLNNRKIKL
ncbi:MAG: VanZ family protein [Candidatus Marinimicrobia bacterium]|nr:VanZ family protein [Candidatus Neomarinimicrobiota bacterium]